MGLLKDKVAIVTGSGRGIGKGIAEVLSEEGALVVVADINEENAKATAEGIMKAGGKACHVAADVSLMDDARKIIEKAINEFGDLHILVNNAGINRDMMLYKMTREAWDEVIAVNLTGVFNCTQAALAHMLGKGYGRIVNISSLGWQGNIGQANYAAAKAGVIGFSKTVAKEVAKKGITCNVICPGFIDTDMTRGVPQKIWDLMVSKIPMGYVGTPRDIGQAVSFLASDKASYITGEILNVGGGMVL